MGPLCSSAETQVCHRSNIIAAIKLPTVKDPMHTGIVYHSVVGLAYRVE
jgi:hypothetical protein